jgi:hypothetical protein
MTHKRTWLALGALLAAIIGGTVWAAEKEKPVPTEDRKADIGFVLDCCAEKGSPCTAKDKTCCEDKCCETTKEKTCCEDKCCETTKEKTCCADGKCCGCCEKAKEKQGVTLPVTPGSTFQVLVAPPTAGMAYEVPIAPSPPQCVAMPPSLGQSCGSSWAATTVPQPTQPMQYTPGSPYASTAYPVGPPAPTPTAYPVTPIPAPSCATQTQNNPWKIRAVVEKDHTCLEMQVNAGGEETRACCENMVLKIGNESLKVAVADKQVQVHGSFVKGSADTVTRNSADGSIFLEGHVKLKYEKGGQKAEVSAERVVVGVADGRLEVKPVPPEQQQVFSFWIGLNH